MAPYRAGGDRALIEREGSVVDDLVRQFADPYAFLRELVQNAIDAGATRVTVRMERGDRGEAHWSVEDDGKGMTLAVIEGPLLTAFSSSKEGDGESIGKYGVGFLSVFALAPTRVRVVTHRAEGAYEVSLDGAHDFEVTELDPRPGHGSTVIVDHPVPAGGDDAHELRGEMALRRWCRHAERRIDLERPSPTGLRKVRIDEPLGLVAPVVVEASEGSIRAWVGPAAGTDRIDGARKSLEGADVFAGYYNRGLTLFESSDARHVVAGVRFKVVSKALRHTLSRDAVVHDAELKRAIDLVKRTAGKPLDEHLTSTLAEAAQRASRDGVWTSFDALLAAAWSRIDKRRVVVPLVPEPTGKARVIDVAAVAASDEPLYAAHDADGVGRAIAARGTRVLRAPSDEGERERYANDLAAMTGKSVHFVEELATKLLPRSAADLGGAADDLAAALVTALRAAGSEIAEVRFAAIRGPGLGCASCLVPKDEKLPLVALASDLEAFRELAPNRQALVLDANHAAVLRSVAIADDDQAVAAALLARLILLEQHGAISALSSDRLLELAAPEP
jgi:hypothetical protein